MEFLRFGSSIPGSYWGCCAVDIIQNFNYHPDNIAAIQIVDGDAGVPCLRDREFLFAGPTYRDIFEARLRIGTFNATDKPNHAFLAVLTQEQIDDDYGREWLAILKEHGFEFIRRMDNSVYTGTTLESSYSPHPNYLFGLFRNISGSRVPDAFLPPTAWTELPSIMPEAYEFVPNGKDLTSAQTEANTAIWKKSETKLFKESELPKGTELWLAGKRSPNPQEPKETREAREKVKIAKEAPKTAEAAPVATGPDGMPF